MIRSLERISHMVFTFRFFVGIFIACVGVGLFLEGIASADPSIAISQTDYNFGELSETALCSHAFTVKNSGTSVLEIKDVKPSCGCTIARFDRQIPPGGEGQITLEVNLRSFQGFVRKTATVVSDDPVNPRLVLTLEGNVKPLIEVRPEKTIYFQGMTSDIGERTIDLVAVAGPFHIRKVDDNLGGNAVYKLETVQDGTHYRLKVSNNAPKGNYRGSITLYTDVAEKPELTVWINAFIEGEIGIRPKVLVVGRLSPDQGELSGKILVVDNKKNDFKILNFTYDQKVIEVTKAQLPDGSGFTLEVKPHMENIPSGSRIKVPLEIETDVPSEGKLEVQIQAINLASPNAK